MVNSNWIIRTLFGEFTKTAAKITTSYFRWKSFFFFFCETSEHCAVKKNRARLRVAIILKNSLYNKFYTHNFECEKKEKRKGRNCRFHFD